MTKLQEIALGVIIAGIIALAGGFYGYNKAATKYKKEVADAQASLVQAQGLNQELLNRITNQNAAIEKLQAAADERAQKAQAVIAQAQAQAHQADHAAQMILIAKPPVGVDKCKAAQEAFDEELKQERGIK
jgi:hydroxypyruvate isomerase